MWRKVIAVKRGMLLLLALVLALSVLGCGEKKEETPANNTVFTDEYFEGLEKMSLLGLTGAISKEEMAEVVQILQDVSLAEAGEYLPEEKNPVLLILYFEDGSAKTVSVSDTIISFNEIGAGKYLVQGEDFFRPFLEAFGVTEE